MGQRELRPYCCCRILVRTLIRWQRCPVDHKRLWLEAHLRNIFKTAVLNQGWLCICKCLNQGIVWRFSNVWGHFWLSSLWGITDIHWVEAWDAVKHPTMCRSALQQRIIQPQNQQCWSWKTTLEITAMMATNYTYQWCVFLILKSTKKISFYRAKQKERLYSSVLSE